MKWAQLAWLSVSAAFATGIALAIAPTNPAWLWLAVIFVASGIGTCVFVAFAMADLNDEIIRLRLANDKAHKALWKAANPHDYHTTVQRAVDTAARLELPEAS